MYGSGYRNDAYNFDYTNAYATQGVDKATFYDSAGDDTFVGRPDRGTLYSAVYRHDVFSFDRTTAYALAGGYDQAIYYDSAGDDVYGAWSDKSIMYGTGYYHDVRGFDRTTAHPKGGSISLGASSTAVVAGRSSKSSGQPS